MNSIWAMIGGFGYGVAPILWLINGQSASKGDARVSRVLLLEQVKVTH